MWMVMQSCVDGCCCFLDLWRARSHVPSILHINHRQRCGTRSPQHLSQSFVVSQNTLNIHNPWWTLFRFPLLSNSSATSLICIKPRFLHSNQVSWNCTSLCTFVYVYPLLSYLYSFYLSVQEIWNEKLSKAVRKLHEVVINRFMKVSCIQVLVSLFRIYVHAYIYT